MVVVVSHYNEDLEWLKKCRWPVVVIDHKGAKKSSFKVKTIIPNLGREASGYLRYIIDNYDNLPDNVAFIHGHETAWHQKRPYPMIDMLNNVILSTDTFELLNGFFVSSYRFHHKHWDILKKWLGPMKYDDVVTDGGAQFIVSRRRILKHPKKAYEEWYDYTMNGDYLPDMLCLLPTKCTMDYEISVFFEYTWHYIFGEQWQMEPKKFPISGQLKEHTLPSIEQVKLIPLFHQTKDFAVIEKLKNVALNI